MRAASLSFAATTAMAVGGLAFAGAGSTGFGVASLEAVMLVGIAAVGAVVARREPQNPCGWLVCVIPASLAAAILGDRVYDQTADAAGQVQGAELIAPWIVSCVWIPAMLSIAAFAQLFPTGRPLNDNWRPFVWIAALAGPPLFVGTAFGGGALEDYPRIDNPVGASGSLGTVVDVIGLVGFALLVLSVLGGLASLIVRFRRSTGVERQQLKWVMTAALTFPVAFAMPTEEVGGDELGFALLLLALFLIASAVAVAILRYRLYDIDVVINRTLVYLALTAILAGIYAGAVLLLQLALSPSSDLAIAASTLAVAALFRPLRARVQAVVDRRFFRRRYDAQATLQAFVTRLRDEVSLEAVEAELRASVAGTVQPTSLGLWLRGDA